MRRFVVPLETSAYDCRANDVADVWWPGALKHVERQHIEEYEVFRDGSRKYTTATWSRCSAATCRAKAVASVAEPTGRCGRKRNGPS